MFEKKILLPHQYYYPHMELLADKSTKTKEDVFFASLNSEGRSKGASVYIHVPFCDSRCAFCGFDKASATADMIAYKDRVIKEIDMYASKKYVQNLKIHTIHIGGGTPTILPRSIFNEILGHAKNRFNISDNLIVNIEGSATTIYKDEVISYILENKISKVSVGVQTFYPKLREQYKSKATLDEVYLTLSKLQNNGITTGIDIMYGFPDFNIGDVKEITFSDIKEAIRLNVDAIDFGQLYPYCNSLERRMKEENLKIPNKETLFDIILTVNDMMDEHGYVQKASYGYTKANKNIKVMESEYYGGIQNVSDCIALGSGAFGYINGYKYRNNSYGAYMRDGSTHFSQLKKLSQTQLQNINIVGFPKLLYLYKTQLAQYDNKEFENKIHKLVSEGLLEETSDVFKVTRIGKCYIDNMYYYLLEDEEKAKIDKQLKILTIS